MFINNKRGWLFLLGIVFLITSGSTCPNTNVDENTGAKLTNPEINIREGNTDISSGGIYEFGSIMINKSVIITFTIENNGNNDLIISENITLTGDSNVFTLAQPSSMIIPLGARQTFSINYNSKNKGEQTASILIKNNDLDEGIYTFTVKGESTSGITYPETGIYGDNILRESSISIITRQPYSLRAELIEGAKLKVVILTSEDIWAQDPLGWIEYDPNNIGGMFGATGVFISESKINDMNISFWDGPYTKTIEIYENDSVTPTRTKTLSY